MRDITKTDKNFKVEAKIEKDDMSVFVYDYDHNSSTPEHLLATQEKCIFY